MLASCFQWIEDFYLQLHLRGCFSSARMACLTVVCGVLMWHSEQEMFRSFGEYHRRRTKNGLLDARNAKFGCEIPRLRL